MVVASAAATREIPCQASLAWETYSKVEISAWQVPCLKPKELDSLVRMKGKKKKKSKTKDKIKSVAFASPFFFFFPRKQKLPVEHF